MFSLCLSSSTAFCRNSFEYFPYFSFRFFATTSFTMEAASDSGRPVSYGSSGAYTNIGAVFTMTGGAGTFWKVVRYLRGK